MTDPPHAAAFKPRNGDPAVQNICGHVLPAMDREAAEQLDSVFQRTK